MGGGFGVGLVWAARRRFDLCFSLFCWENSSLVSNTSSNTMGACNSGIPTATTRDQRSRLDEALDHLDTALTDLIDTLDTGGLDHLSTDEKVTVWQRFETLRNRQPLIDHQFIADAEASDLPREYCSSTMTQFLIRVLQLSPGDAAARSEPPRPSGRVPQCSAYA